MSGGSVPGGSCAGDLRDALGDELARAVVVGVGLELDRDLRDAELRVRADAAHVRQPGERDLERDGDARSRAPRRPSPAFCTMTLNTGADRSGNTSRGRSCSQTPPSAGARQRPAATVSSGAWNDVANDAR